MLETATNPISAIGNGIILNGLCHQEILTIRADDGELWSVAWSPDGKRLATGGADGAVKLWDAATGRPIASFPGHTGRGARRRLVTGWR